MKDDEFEKHLKAQPLRSLSPKWREEILRAGETAQPRVVEQAGTRFAQWLREMLWPHPKAWAALAALWILIIGVNLSVRDGGSSPEPVRGNYPESWLVALAEQRRLWLELVEPGVSATEESPPPKRDGEAGPRSQHDEGTRTG